MTPHASSTDRLYFLDWLRVLAFAALVIYHVGMYYVSWDFHVKSPWAGPGLEPWMKLSEPWRMSLLFMVSGAVTACMLKSGPSWSLVRRRSAYLLLPLLCGIVLIVPPQSYFEAQQKFGYTGGYLDFLQLYFRGYRGFCNHGHCLILPTWNHLWFLAYLWAYTLLLCGVLALWPTALQASSRIAHAALRGVWLLLIPVGFIWVARLTLFARYPATHALADDWFSHSIYLGMFSLGAVFATPRVTAPTMLWARLAAMRWPALLGAITFWATLVFVRPPQLAEHAVVAIYQWTALVAAFGFAQVHLNRNSALRDRLTEAVFPVYVLHQTVLIMASQLLLPLHWAAAVEGPVLVTITFAFSYAGYVLARQLGVLRPWLGMRAA